MRGPKIHTAHNAPPGARERVQRDAVVPTSELTPRGLKHFELIVEEIGSRGCLDRVSLATLTDFARISDLLDELHGKFHGLEPKARLGMVALLTAQRRGLLRELGMTIKPSTTLVRTQGHAPQGKSKLEDLFKVHSS